jgi:hypothetical protein
MTIDDLIQELSRIDDEARALVAPLSDAQAGWQPDGGRRWSVTQNLQHLAKTNVVYVEALRKGRRGGAQPSAAGIDLEGIPGPFGRLFIGVMEPPPRFRVKTRAIVQPASTGTVRDALAAFLASQEGVRRFVRDVGASDLRSKFTSPFGPLRPRIGTGLLVLAAHDRRHLWQARRVLEAEGFPGNR